MTYRYEKEFDTPYTSIDRSGRLGLVSCFDINQDMITEFFGSIGSDNKLLKDNDNAAWIYTKSLMKINNLPFWNTPTKATAFISAKSGIRVDVEVHLKDIEGNILFAAKTEMCVIDLSARKIKKIADITFPEDLETEPSQIDAAFVRMKDEFTQEEKALSEKVYASDTDFTGHTNNARYVKYLTNTFTTDFYDTRAVTGFEIQFMKESKEGAVLDIYEKREDNTVKYLIRSGEDDIVRALMTYSGSSVDYCDA